MPDNYVLNFSDIGEHYRAIAGKLRELARVGALLGARRRVVELAASFKRKAKHVQRSRWRRRTQQA
jgi:hypothetical protein